MNQNQDPSTRPGRSIEWGRLLETALTSPGSVGDVYNRFYSYSFMNQILLLMQGASEPVATYKRWQSLGRQVLRGSKALSIVRPIVIKRKDADEEEPAERVLFKPMACLFTVSQTSGDALPEREPTGWDLDRALSSLDIRQVPFQLLDGNIQGCSAGREIAINPVAADPVRTRFHELGHVVLGHTVDAPSEAAADVHRGIGEFQAEATAFLTMIELGAQTEGSASHSRGYMQDWLRREQPSDEAIRQVFRATDALLRAGRPAPTVNGALDV